MFGGWFKRSSVQMRGYPTLQPPMEIDATSDDHPARRDGLKPEIFGHFLAGEDPGPADGRRLRRPDDEALGLREHPAPGQGPAAAGRHPRDRLAKPAR